jgi:hypothetical protein
MPDLLFLKHMVTWGHNRRSIKLSEIWNSITGITTLEINPTQIKNRAVFSGVYVQHPANHVSTETHTSKISETRGKILPFQIREEKLSELVQNSDVTTFCDADDTVAPLSS